MVLVVLVVASLGAGAAAGVALRRWPGADRSPPVAIGVIAVCATVFAALTFTVRENRRVALDVDVARWAARHASAPVTDVLRLITEFGSGPVVVVVAVAVAAATGFRLRSWLPAGFMVLTVIGVNLLQGATKDLVGRVRPGFDQLVAAHGPSFPSGHTLNAAAVYMAGAFVLGLARPPRPRAALTGAAVALAVAVGASRAMLGVHWLTDVAGGLALGWLWFTACALAFGRWMLALDHAPGPAP